MTTTITEVIELKKDYNKEKLCNYFCNLCELKYIDLFDPFIFWEFVKNEHKYYSIEIKLKRGDKYFIKTSVLQRGEFFNELEYGILYMIAKSVKKMIENLNFLKLQYPDAKVDYRKWENYKQEIRNIAFNNYLNKQGI